jgi:hypothetical protein
MKKLLIFFLPLLFLTGCEATNQFLSTVDDTLNGDDGVPTNSEVASGLKSALEIGIGNGADALSKTDGYFKDEMLKILWPEEAVKVENTLRDVGLGNLCDDVILSFNRAAEAAASEAKPIFVNAIKEMTFQDAMNILLGEKDAATQYLKDKTSAQIQEAFSPVIDDKLAAVGATRYWGQAAEAYNKIPFVKPVETDIVAYVTDRAMDGLFKVVADEEAKIRERFTKISARRSHR